MVKGRLLLLLVVLLPLAASGVSAVKRFALPAPEQIEKELLEMINLDRERLGRQPLLPDPRLQEIARSHSAKMAAEGELSHHFPDWPSPEQKLRLGDVCFLASAENVAYSPSPSAKTIHDALMGSAGHRMNILDGRMHQAGIGVCQKGDDLYVSEEFAAIIACPDAGEATAFIADDLRRWYGEEFGQNLALAADAGVWARVSAQQNLIDNPIAPAPLNASKVQVIEVKFNDLETILAELKKEIRHNRARSFAVGVAWGRTAGFPGGTYSVSLLLFD